MKFSVALCTYNGEKYIREQLQSILDQTWPVSEIVISDDGSTDSTLSIIRQLIEEKGPDSRVKFTLFQNEIPLGIEKNFEKCISLTTHDWVFLSDQDDVWLEDKVAIFQQEIQRNPSAMFICSNAVISDENNESLGYTLFEALRVTSRELRMLNNQEAFPVLLGRNIATGATCLVHKSVFGNAQPFPLFWLHDEWMAIISAYCGSFGFIQTPTIYYRQHASNAVGLRKQKFRNRISKYREPRNERNTHLVNRASVLLGHLPKIKKGLESNQTQNNDLLAQKYSFFLQQRLSSNPNRLVRWIPLTAWLLEGNYSRFTRGAKDFFKDLVQPDIKHSAN